MKKRAQEVSGTRVVQQAIGFRGEHLRLEEGTTRCEIPQHPIWWRTPKEIGQPCGQLVGAQISPANVLLRFATEWLDEIEKARRCQHERERFGECLTMVLAVTAAILIHRPQPFQKAGRCLVTTEGLQAKVLQRLGQFCCWDLAIGITHHCGDCLHTRCGRFCRQTFHFRPINPDREIWTNPVLRNPGAFFEVRLVVVVVSAAFPHKERPRPFGRKRNRELDNLRLSQGSDNHASAVVFEGVPPADAQSELDETPFWGNLL